MEPAPRMIPVSCNIVRPKWSLMSRMPSRIDCRRIMSCISGCRLSVISCRQPTTDNRELFAALDQPVDDLDAPLRRIGDSRIVRDQDDRLVVRGQVAEDVDDLPARLLIEVAGG